MDSAETGTPSFAGDYAALAERLDTWIRDGAPGDRFEQFALEVYRFQLRHNAPYRRFCESLLGADGTRQVASPEAIPAVPTDAFKLSEHLPVCFPEPEAEVVFQTSGTTIGTRGRHPFFDTGLYRTSLKRAWAGLGLPAGPLIALAQSPDDAPDSSLSFMLGELDATFAIDRSGTIDRDVLAWFRSHDRGPVVLFGTALALLHLIESGTTPTRLPPGSTVVETGGYKGTGRSLEKTYLYRLITRQFGIPDVAVVNEYSMTELSSQFYARGPAGFHHSQPWARVYVTDPDDGKPVPDGATGYLRVLDLANLGSVAAVATQDFAVRRGDAFELLGRDPGSLPRGCSIGAGELLASTPAGPTAPPARDHSQDPPC